jgi:hypothetical protein
VEVDVEGNHRWFELYRFTDQDGEASIQRIELSERVPALQLEAGPLLLRLSPGSTSQAGLR